MIEPRCKIFVKATAEKPDYVIEFISNRKIYSNLAQFSHFFATTM